MLWRMRWLGRHKIPIYLCSRHVWFLGQLEHLVDQLWLWHADTHAALQQPNLWLGLFW